MRIFIKNLNPCAARRANVLQYRDFFRLNGHEIVPEPDGADVVLIWGCGFRTDYKVNTVEQANHYKKVGGGNVSYWQGAFLK